MRKISEGQKRLIADYLANIGIAWFAAGVIGVFVSRIKNPFQIIVSVSWGLSFSLLFIFSGFYLMKGIKS